MDLSAHLQHEIFKAIGRAGDALNYPVFVVGGYVRDLLLKRTSKDIDFVCVGSGIELARRSAKFLDPPLRRKGL